MVILIVLNWGVYRGHEIFVMMMPGFLSYLNSCIFFKAWLDYNRSFTGKNILLDHIIRLRVAYETLTRPTVDAH